MSFEISKPHYIEYSLELLGYLLSIHYVDNKKGTESEEDDEP